MHAWARAARADSTLPVVCHKILAVLLEHLRAGDGRAVLFERELVDEAGLLDPAAVRLLLARGWVSRTAKGGDKRAAYIPTVPLPAAHLAETA